MTRGEWLKRIAGLSVCMMLAGCLGSGSSNDTPEIDEGPDVIADTPDDTPDTTPGDPVSPDDPESPDVIIVTPSTTNPDGEEEEDDVVDIITDVVTSILTTSVSVTTITATGGS